MTELGLYSNKPPPSCYPNASKLNVTLYQDMLKEEVEIVRQEYYNNVKQADEKIDE